MNCCALPLRRASHRLAPQPQTSLKAKLDAIGLRRLDAQRRVKAAEPKQSTSNAARRPETNHGRASGVKIA